MLASVIVAKLAVLCFAGLVFSAAINDILTYTIPNRICLALALLYPAYALATPQPVEWLPALGIAAAALAVGFALFSLRYCGAGDAKLFAVVALWGGPELVQQVILVTTLSGAMIAIFVWLQHRFAGASLSALAVQGPAPASLRKQQIPYGAAIAVAALYVAFTLLRIG